MTPPQVPSPLIVVEDSRADWETVALLLTEAGVKRSLVHYKNGEEALAYLKELKQKDSSYLPAHVLLDLNLPGVSGLEVLNRLKTDRYLSQIPVTVLTSSSHPRDIESCYRAGANSYLIKPIEFDRFETMLRRFVEYWLDTVKLPESEVV
ncbi:MAG: response regulator [Acidobacteriaceae bacterium]|nr:response regulator [Acidobacteriaceae bacterium]